MTTDVWEYPPRASTLDAASYIDFTEGLRSFTLSRLFGGSREEITRALSEREISDMRELREEFDRYPIVQFTNRFLRSQQEMTWEMVRRTLTERADELVTELDEAEAAAPERLKYDMDFSYPKYFEDYEIHLQPGNYERDSLAGYIYHYGVDVFYAGRNDNNAAKQASVDTLPVPDGLEVNRVLDLACSVGQGTTALKRRYPDAEVIGVDIAAPMVRYAHKRAVSLGSDVTFVQADGAELPFEDDSFDLVHINILFHELPRDHSRRVLEEVHRVLRPGGAVIILDFTSRDPKGPFDSMDYFRDIDSRYNGEPFASPFVYSDFAGLIESVFGNVIPNARQDPTGIRETRVATK